MDYLAEGEIALPGQPPTWIIDLFQASEAKSALEALYTGFKRIEVSEQDWDGLTSMLIGFLYLRYLEGGISLSEFLGEAGDEADNANYNNPMCETIFALLNEYERLTSSGASIQPVSDKARVMFARHQQLAEEALAVLKREIV